MVRFRGSGRGRDGISLSGVDTLVFLTGKLVGLLIRPDTWLLAGLGLSILFLWRGRLRQARGFGLATLIGAAALMILPLGDLALRPLETRYPPAPPLGEIDGILVLGGAESGELTEFWGPVQLNGAAERMTGGLALARAHPQAQLVFTGRSGAVRHTFGGGTPGAEVARRFYAELGFDPARLMLEGASRTTAENARLSRALVTPGGTWVLVTSAFHMPRAMASFRAAGWPGTQPGTQPGTLVAWPVDHRGGPLRPGWDLTGQMEKLQIALREYVGLAGYRLLGRG